LIKQLQQQGFAEIVADLLGGMIGLIIETAKLSSTPAPTSGIRVAMQAPSLLRTVLT
jgi:hypothetical protein